MQKKRRLYSTFPSKISRNDRVEPIIDLLLSQEQAGFQQGRSTVYQVQVSFSAKKNAGAVFVALTAAYGIVWHRGFISKLYCDCYLTGICSAQSWNWLATTVSPLPGMI